MEILKSVIYWILMIFGGIVACIFSNILLDGYEKKLSNFLGLNE